MGMNIPVHSCSYGMVCDERWVAARMPGARMSDKLHQPNGITRKTDEENDQLLEILSSLKNSRRDHFLYLGNHTVFLVRSTNNFYAIFLHYTYAKRQVFDGEPERMET